MFLDLQSYFHLKQPAWFLPPRTEWVVFQMLKKIQHKGEILIIPMEILYAERADSSHQRWTS